MGINPVVQAADLLQSELDRLTAVGAGKGEELRNLQLEIASIDRERERLASVLKALRSPNELIQVPPVQPVRVTHGDMTVLGAITETIGALVEFSGFRSVREAVQTAMEAREGPWTPADLVALLGTQRGQFRVKDLGNAVRTALWAMRRDGVVVALSDGRNVAAKWIATGPGEVRTIDAPALSGGIALPLE